MRFTKIFISSVLTSLLIGCAQTPPQTSPSHFEKSKASVEQYTHDALITSKVKAKYLKDFRLKSAGISVSTSHGVVSLVGAVPDQATKDHAVQLAQSTKGVVAVNADNLLNTIKAMSLQPPPVKNKSKAQIKPLHYQ